LPGVTLKSADQRLAGLVLAVDGRPFAGAQVQLTGAEQFPQTTLTDAGGHFSFSGVADGRVAVYVGDTNVTAGGVRRLGGAAARGGDLNVLVQLKAPRDGSSIGGGPAGAGTNGFR
jgi:hypothetical protein